MAGEKELFNQSLVTSLDNNDRIALSQPGIEGGKNMLWSVFLGLVAPSWGGITGDILTQTDLQAQFDTKADYYIIKDSDEDTYVSVDNGADPDVITVRSALSSGDGFKIFNSLGELAFSVNQAGSIKTNSINDISGDRIYINAPRTHFRNEGAIVFNNDGDNGEVVNIRAIDADTGRVTTIKDFEFYNRGSLYASMGAEVRTEAGTYGNFLNRIATTQIGAKGATSGTLGDTLSITGGLVNNPTGSSGTTFVGGDVKINGGRVTTTSTADQNVTGGNILIDGGLASTAGIGTATQGDILVGTLRGNLGVGNASPAEKLDVTGNINATGYKINGNAGVSGSFTTITSIIIENGLITTVTGT